MTKNEVSPRRMAEYKAIRRKVDDKARYLTCRELDAPVYYAPAMFFIFWEYKKRILRKDYHMLWRSPMDLDPAAAY